MKYFATIFCFFLLQCSSLTAYANSPQNTNDFRKILTGYHSAFVRGDLEAMRSFWDTRSPFYLGYFEDLGKSLAAGTAKVSGEASVTSITQKSDVPRLRFMVSVDGKLQHMTIQFIKADATWKIGRILESTLDMAYHLGRLNDRVKQRQFLEESPELKTPEMLESLQYHLFELTNRGQFESALSLADFGIEIAREINDQPHLGRIMIRRSTIFEQSGEYAKATEQLLSAIDFARSIGDRQMEGISMYYMARALAIQGDKDASNNYLRRAAAIAETVNNVVLTNQVLNLQALGLPDPKDRLPINNRLLANMRLRGNKYGEAAVLANIAQCHSDLGDQTKAIEIISESMRIFTEIGSVSEPISVQNSLSVFHDRAGRTSEALTWAEKSLAAAISANLDTVPVRRQLFQLYDKLGRIEDAKRMVEENISINERARQKVLSDDVMQARFLQERSVDYQNLIRISSESATPLEALKATELFKARVLFDVLNAGKDKPNVSLSSNEIRSKEALTNALSLANRNLLFEKQKEFQQPNLIAKAEAEVLNARLALNDFRLKLYAEKPELKISRGDFQPLDENDLRRLIPDDRTALLAFAVTEKKSFGYLIMSAAGRIDIDVFPIEMNSSELAKRVAGLRLKIQTADLSFAKESNDLYGLLISPIAKKLSRAENVIVVPDSVLWEVPFQALRPPNGRYFIESHSIGYAQSLTALSEMKKRSLPFAPSSLLAFANPAIANDQRSKVEKFRGERLSPLPDAESEVDAIAKEIGTRKSLVFRGAAATESVFRELGPSASVLHFATHGILNSQNPMYSSLLLSSVGESNNDGMLESWEIMEMKLQAGLAVLSACETGRGHSVGEGLIGITWSFFVAGVPRVVASQWKVDSKSTSVLMKSFYQNLVSNRPPSIPKALQKAMTRQIRTGSRKHPFYWAGLIAIGP